MESGSSSSSTATFKGDGLLIYWFRVSIFERIGDISSHLFQQKGLTLVCKSLSKVVMNFIEDTCWFIQPKQETPNFQFYSPKKLKNVHVCQIPLSVRQVKFGDSYNSSFDLPQNKISHTNITHLTLSYQFNENVNADNLPRNLTNVVFGERFNKLVDNLPKTILKLHFGHDFNSSVDSLPPNLQYLKLGYKFNLSVDKLPQTLTHLYFGSDFNALVDNLPPNITHLKFGFEFDRTVDNLPPNITHLKFGFLFNQNVERLPQSITHLVFGYRFNAQINLLPRSVTHLEFSVYFSRPLDVGVLPRGLVRVGVHQNYKHKIEGFPFVIDVSR